MRFGVDSCDLGLTAESGRCAIDTSAIGDVRTLGARHRVARLVAGVLFAAIARVLVKGPLTAPIRVLTGWFAVSHAVAAATGYGGCPELGAIPSVIARRSVSTECGPWEWIDAKLDEA